tara:strand:+ start:63 stop:338 length:276 start_codon:yes stop_codon:yes gene_type:complete
MQKVINVLAVASFALSGAIAVSGVYVYVNRDSIIDGVKQKVMGGFGGAALGGAAGSLGGGALTGDVGLPKQTQPEPSAPVPQTAPSEFANF